MKRFQQQTLRLIITLLLTAAITACDKVPENGKLDGMWQLTAVETPQKVTDKLKDVLYLSFQLDMNSWAQRGTGIQFFSHFTHSNDSIIFYNLCRPAEHSLADPDDHPVQVEEITAGALSAWGINSAKLHFAVKKLTGKDMLLQQADTLLRFRKF